MTDVSNAAWAIPVQEEETLPLPAPVPFGAPVLIADCATPLGSETLLSLLLRRLSDQP